MLKRLHRLAIARIVLAMMLFAQGVMASEACVWLERSPDRAVVAASEVAPCHDSGFGGACLTHCLLDRQAVQKATIDLPAMPAAPVLIVQARMDLARRPTIDPVSDDPPSTGPPRRILLQSFQI